MARSSWYTLDLREMSIEGGGGYLDSIVESIQTLRNSEFMMDELATGRLVFRSFAQRQQRTEALERRGHLRRDPAAEFFMPRARKGGGGASAERGQWRARRLWQPMPRHHGLKARDRRAFHAAHPIPEGAILIPFRVFNKGRKEGVAEIFARQSLRRHRGEVIGGARREGGGHVCFERRNAHTGHSLPDNHRRISRQ